MKWFVYIVSFVLAALLIGPVFGAQPGKFRGGRLGEPPNKTTDPAKKTPVATAPAKRTNKPPFIKTVKDNLDTLAKKIKTLEAKDRKTLTVIGLTYANDRLEKLKKDSEKQRSKLERSGLKAVQEVNRDVERLMKKWEPLSEALKSETDKRHTSKQWQDIARKIMKETPEPVENPPAGIGQPADGPPREPDTRRPQKVFGEIAKTINDQAKPPGMSETAWAALLDQFQKDNSQLQAKSAALTRKWKQQRDQQFEPVYKSLAAAKNTLAALQKLPEEKMNEGYRNHMAKRLHDAELAKTRRELRDAEGLYHELQKTPGGLERQLIVASSTGDYLDVRFTKALELMGRLMDTNTSAIPPSLEAFDKQTADELKDLFGGDLDSSDPDALTERIRQARVRFLQERLRVLNDHQTNVEKVIDASDQEEVDIQQRGMRFDDRLDDRVDHPINQAKRRVAEKEFRKQQRDTREERIDNAKFELRVEIGKTKKRLAGQMENATKPSE